MEMKKTCGGFSRNAKSKVSLGDLALGERMVSKPGIRKRV
jgi:hypothetical protein